MYLNGSLDQTDNSNGKVNLLSTNKTYLGKNGRNNNSFYTGKVDDLKIYNRALSVSEIQTLFYTSDWSIINFGKYKFKLIWDRSPLYLSQFIN